jgi:hypothetical protein
LSRGEYGPHPPCGVVRMRVNFNSHFVGVNILMLKLTVRRGQSKTSRQAHRPSRLLWHVIQYRFIPNLCCTSAKSGFFLAHTNLFSRVTRSESFRILLHICKSCFFSHIQILYHVGTPFRDLPTSHGE